MKKIIMSLLAAMGLGVGAAAQSPAAPKAPDLENILYIETEAGRIEIEMRPDKAPKHVERIKLLARQGFYDGLVFHRVIPGFMAQGGDPAGDGSGGSDLPDLPAEFNDLRHLRGTASMARTNDPNSANSQFFICFQPTPFLDNQYTAWGRVVGGMRVVDQIAVGEPPAEPTKMLSVRVAADVEG